MKKIISKIKSNIKWESELISKKYKYIISNFNNKELDKIKNEKKVIFA